MMISFLIPTIHNPEAISRCVDSIVSQRHETEIQIVIALDKMNTYSVEKYSSFFMQHDFINVVKAECPGVNAARNTAILNASGSLLYFLDDDCHLPCFDWIERFLSIVKSNPNIDAFGGRCVSREGGGFLERCVNRMHDLHLKEYCLVEGDTNALLGGNTGYRSSVFDLCGLFDERIIYGGAETEFNNRLLLSGRKMGFFEDLNVIHYNSVRYTALLSKSFMQGSGAAYSVKKNDYSPSKKVIIMKGLWFLKEGTRMNTHVLNRVKVVIIFANMTAFFLLGYYWRLFCCRIIADA